MTEFILSCYFPAKKRDVYRYIRVTALISWKEGLQMSHEIQYLNKSFYVISAYKGSKTQTKTLLFF